jgi:thiosulfate dehydrogenase
MIFGPWLLVLLICGFAAGEASAQSAQPAVAGTSAGSDQLPPWRVPDITSLPNDEHGVLVRYGRELINHTTALIGPDASSPAQRYTGNGLECTNCHLNAGTSRYAIPLVGIANLYPAFSARLNARQDLAGRVNDCMQRSMNGRPLPLDSREMQALLAYLTFLGLEQPAGQAPAGRGAPKLPLPTRAADPRHGAIVYQDVCAACHQANGLGVKFQTGDRLTERRRYLYPPLWGSDSYNDAAGMARIVTAAWFVHANMPNGVTWEYPLLAADDAYDVMAFVDTQPRPHKADLTKDYPNPWLKPIGTLYPPWVGGFSTAQNRFGPWQPILDWRRDNPPATGSEGVTAANDIEQSIHAVSRAP